MLLFGLSFVPAILAITYEVKLVSDVAQKSVYCGKVTFCQDDEKSPVKIRGKVEGLAPNSKHGFHIHTAPVTNQNCTTAGAHWNPSNVTHGAPNSYPRHIGDFPMLEADSKGVATIKETNTLLTLFGTGNFSIKNRALVMHELMDDYGTLPNNATSLATGNSG